MGLIAWAFLTTGLKSRLSSHGPLLTLADTTICFLSSAPMVSLMKRFVLVFMASSPFLPLLLLDLLLHRREDVPLDPEGVVVGGVMGREAGGVGGEDLAPDPREADEPSHHPLEEGAWHPQQELLDGGEMGELGEAQHVEQPLGRGQVVVDVLPVGLPDPL